MMTVAASLILIVVLFALGLFIARQILRLAIKLALVSAVVFALGAGGVLGWWRGWFGSSLPSVQRPVPQSNQQRNSNRKPSPR